MYQQRQKRDDFRGAAAYVVANARPGDAAAFFSYAIRAPFEWYLRREGLPPTSLRFVELASAPYSRGDGLPLPEPNRETLAGLPRRYGRLFLVVSHASASLAQGRVEQLQGITSAIETRYALVGEAPFVGIEVRLYERR